MGLLIEKTANLFEQVGVINSVLIVILFLFLAIGLIYLGVLIESYWSGTGSLMKIVSYGKYKIEVKKDNGETIDYITLKAWNKINAIERAIKKNDQIIDSVLIVTKL